MSRCPSFLQVKFGLPLEGLLNSAPFVLTQADELRLKLLDGLDELNYPLVLKKYLRVYLLWARA
jgi:hypothetical protein